MEQLSSHDISELRQLYERHNRSVDDCDGDAWSSLYSQSGVFDGAVRLVGRAGIRDYGNTRRSSLEKLGYESTQHRTGDVLFRREDCHRIRAVAYIAVWAETATDHKLEIPFLGRYVDAIVRQKGEWLIHNRKVSFDTSGDLYALGDLGAPLSLDRSLLSYSARDAIADAYARYNHALTYSQSSAFEVVCTAGALDSVATKLATKQRGLRQNGYAIVQHWTTSLEIIHCSPREARTASTISTIGKVEDDPSALFVEMATTRDVLTLTDRGWAFSKRSLKGEDRSQPPKANGRRS